MKPPWKKSCMLRWPQTAASFLPTPYMRAKAPLPYGVAGEHDFEHCRVRHLVGSEDLDLSRIDYGMCRLLSAFGCTCVLVELPIGPGSPGKNVPPNSGGIWCFFDWCRINLNRSEPAGSGNYYTRVVHTAVSHTTFSTPTAVFTHTVGGSCSQCTSCCHESQRPR